MNSGTAGKEEATLVIRTEKIECRWLAKPTVRVYVKYSLAILLKSVLKVVLVHIWYGLIQSKH